MRAYLKKTGIVRHTETEENRNRDRAKQRETARQKNRGRNRQTDRQKELRIKSYRPISLQYIHRNSGTYTHAVAVGCKETCT